jgi:hypothetical protein
MSEEENRSASQLEPCNSRSLANSFPQGKKTCLLQLPAGEYSSDSRLRSAISSNNEATLRHLVCSDDAIVAIEVRRLRFKVA